MNSDYAILVEQVSKKYKLYKNKRDRMIEALFPFRNTHRDFFALKNINIRVNKGEILGIIGKNGSGKSTLLKIMSGILTPTSGKVQSRGTIIALLELGAGFNPEFTGIENVFFYCSILGYKKDEIRKKLKEIIDFSEIGEHLDQPLKTYSSGMKARLAFSVSIHVNPDILIVDEILSVGDEQFQRKSYLKMEEFFKSGKTVLFVSHNTSAINRLCTRAIFLHEGEKILEGPSSFVTKHYEKYLYSIDIKRDEILNELRLLNYNEDLKKEYKSRQEDIKENSHDDSDFYSPDSIPKDGTEDSYLPGLKPASTLITKNFDLNIYDFKMLNLQNEMVNILTTGDEYIFSFKVELGEAVKNFIAGISINTPKGIMLGGATVHHWNQSQLPLKLFKDDIYLLEWKWKCNLMDGSYYISIITRQKPAADEIVLCKITDAYIFKVRSNTKSFYSGPVFFDQKTKIHKLND